MNAVYQLNTEDLGKNFIESVKKLYPSKPISIIISDELNEVLRDDTTYLRSSKKNQKILMKRISNVSHKIHLKTLTPEEFETISGI